MKRGRKKLPNELKAKNWTIKVYDWEKEPIKEFIKKRRFAMKEQEEYKISKEMEEKYGKVFDYEPDIEESAKKFSPEFDAELDEMLDELLKD